MEPGRLTGIFAKLASANKIRPSSMKTLGMIGGTSWHSTIDYYRLINKIGGKKLKGKGNPPLLLYSLNIELMRGMDLDKINAGYLDISKRLQDAGAEGIIICANTPHIVYPFIAPQINIPILHIADATGKGAALLKLKKLGLLGTKATMEKDFLKNRLHNKHGIEIIVPEDTGRAEIQRIISEELTHGKMNNNSRVYLIQAMRKLQEQGAEGIILGCTELPLLIKSKDFELPLLNTTELHAQMAVDFIFGE